MSAASQSRARARARASALARAQCLSGKEAARRSAALATGVTAPAAAAGGRPSVAVTGAICKPGHAALGVLEHDARIVFDGGGGRAAAVTAAAARLTGVDDVAIAGAGIGIHGAGRRARVLIMGDGRCMGAGGGHLDRISGGWLDRMSVTSQSCWHVHIMLVWIRSVESAAR